MILNLAAIAVTISSTRLLLLSIAAALPLKAPIVALFRISSLELSRFGIRVRIVGVRIVGIRIGTGCIGIHGPVVLAASLFRRVVVIFDIQVHTHRRHAPADVRVLLHFLRTRPVLRQTLQSRRPHLRLQPRRRAGRLGGVDGVIGVARAGDDGGARGGVAAGGGGGGEGDARGEVGVVAVGVVALAVVVFLVVAPAMVVVMNGEAEGLIPVKVGGRRVRGHAVGVAIVAGVLRGEFDSDPRRMRGSGLQRHVVQAPLIGIFSRERDHGPVVHGEVLDSSVAGGGAAFRPASPAADALVVVDDAERARVQEGFPFAGSAAPLNLHEGMAFTSPFAVDFADHGCWVAV